MHSFLNGKIKIVRHLKIKIKIHAFIYAFKTKANHKFPCIQNKNKL